jgi:hypothetical protein
VDERKAGGRMRALAAAPVVRESDGVVEVGVGTTLFGVAVVVGLLTRDWLEARGWGWWLDVAIAGFVLGLVGLAYCGYRRRRLDVRGPGRG